jgi:hypothetical protein
MFLVPVKHKMKFRRTLPDVILYGPRGLGGLKFPQCPTDQGMGHLKMVFGHLREPKLAGMAISVNIAALQMENGLTTQIFQSDYKYNMWCTLGWVNITGWFLRQNHIKIISSQLWSPEAHLRDDTSTMQIICDNSPPSFKPWQLRAVN